MTKRSTRKKPQALKKLQGTYRPDRDGGADDALSDKKPNCPAWLSKEAKSEWRRIANDLHDAGLLKYVDRAALAAYCEAYGRWQQAEKLVQEKGLLVKTKNGNVIQSPAVGVANVAMRDMLKLLKEFGMTPVSRSRLPAKAGEKKEETLAEQLFSAING
jgi:P27 family predicted phage terminase small subunit